MRKPDTYRKALNIHGLLRAAIVASSNTHLDIEGVFDGGGNGALETIEVAELMMRDLLDDFDALMREASRAERGRQAA